ncbi:hypothetical protein HK100_006290 [Physocladia obscura]|uniref:Uncharacterized protein n=1 Tax=Physocladia obscura TaxID=109957 RepID=A0AAD5T5W0_9FUNG|nr:hypothetical protein HK100_006290 [Physocladia obscura]
MHHQKIVSKKMSTIQVHGFGALGHSIKYAIKANLDPYQPDFAIGNYSHHRHIGSMTRLWSDANWGSYFPVLEGALITPEFNLTVMRTNFVDIDLELTLRIPRFGMDVAFEWGPITEIHNLNDIVFSVQCHLKKVAISCEDYAFTGIQLNGFDNIRAATHVPILGPLFAAGVNVAENSINTKLSNTIRHQITKTLKTFIQTTNGEIARILYIFKHEFRLISVGCTYGAVVALVLNCSIAFYSVYAAAVFWMIGTNL